MSPPHEGTPLVPVVLANQPVPAAIRVFEDAAVAQWNIHATAAEVVSVVDDATLEVANNLAVKLSAALKVIEARDKELRGPLKQTMDAVRDVTDRVSEPLDRAKRALVNKIGQFDQKRRAEAERLRQEAQARHDAEVRRVQAERDRIAKEASDALEREARELAELMGETPPPPAPAAKAEPPADTSFPFGASEPAPPARVIKAPPPAVASAATMKKVQRLRIIDLSKVPYKIGDEILIQACESAILRVLKAGALVPGCELVTEEVASMKPVRDPDPHFG